MAAHSGDNIKLCTNPNLTNVVDGHWFLGACRIGKKRQDFFQLSQNFQTFTEMIKAQRVQITCSAN